MEQMTANLSAGVRSSVALRAHMPLPRPVTGVSAGSSAWGASRRRAVADAERVTRAWLRELRQ